MSDDMSLNIFGYGCKYDLLRLLIIASPMCQKENFQCCAGCCACAQGQVDERLVKASNMHVNEIVREDSSHGNHATCAQAAKRASKNEAFYGLSKSIPKAG